MLARIADPIMGRLVLNEREIAHHVHYRSLDPALCPRNGANSIMYVNACFRQLTLTSKLLVIRSEPLTLVRWKHVTPTGGCRHHQIRLSQLECYRRGNSRIFVVRRLDLTLYRTMPASIGTGVGSSQGKAYNAHAGCL